MLENGHHLNGQYTAIGKVTRGMKYVDNIKKGDASQNGVVEEPDKMISVTSK
jgi:peptidylprolyl isomerase